MSPRSKREYLEAILVRYRRAARKVKTAILSEFCSTCNYHRKHALRLLNTAQRFQKPKKHPRGRKPVYRQSELLIPLTRIWKAAYMPCSKRLKCILPVWLPGYAKTYGPLPLPVVKAKPKTPYQRILGSLDILKETKNQLTDKFKTLNPFELRKAMEEKLKRIFPR